jgi:hypothetical protein
MCLRPGPRDKVRVDAEGDDLKFDVEKGAASQEVSSADADEMLAGSLSGH